MANHPMQPLERDPKDDRFHFKPNGIIQFLMNHARENGMSLSLLADMPWPKEDWDQFYQLLGFDLDGYGTSSLVSDGAKDLAEAAERLMRGGKELADKESKDMETRREMGAHLPGCHPSRGCVEGCWNYDADSEG